ncbi:MAG: Hpt domain-containing protein [Desulfobacula sp.]|uniref:Hpt domain-containing protein n=1 Tax=Desulfobacula sp. TaxID=2593537 RepID=UPI0025C468C7|nr:Hpt domain-containing protein [Desulfobacula sp.]MCD4719857.1 Hpt domain-containing protein [Desulfobacula sp.]
MNSEEHDSLDAMSSEFIAEIKDDLASLEPDLLAMEEKGGNVDDDLINHAFRSIHSIKGGAGFINFKALASLGHAMENVLMRVREKKLVITSEIVDALLSGFDKMKLMVDLMGTDQACDYETQKAALQKILNPETPRMAESKSSVKARQPKPRQKVKKSEDTLQIIKPLGDSSLFRDKEFYVDKKRLENALNSQKFVYAVHIRFENDIVAKHKDVDSIIDDIKSNDDILFSDFENKKCENGKEGFF